MVVIPVQVDLIDVPAGINVVSIGIEHDQDVKFGVLKNVNGFLVPFAPGVDVPLGGQISQGRAKVFVAVVPSVDVDHFLCSPVGFCLHGPVGQAHDPQGFSEF